MRRASIIATAVVTTVAVAGCGAGSSSDPPPAAGSSSAVRLLSQTFAGHHTIKSGVLALDLVLRPTGSSTITKPLELSLVGPFRSDGAGKPPESDFTVSLTAQGRSVSLQVISAAGNGYITIAGQSYLMPAASFKKLASGFGSLATTGGSAGSKSSTLSKLGVHPLDWLTDPRVVGQASVDGTATTRIRAGIDTRALLHDLSDLLGRARSLGIGGSSGEHLPRSISPATQKSIAHALGRPTLDVWTGDADRILRRLTVSADVPVTGQTSTLLGGMTSASVTLDFNYSQLNQPQTITAPTSVKPYSVFRSQVATFLEQLESGLGAGGPATTTTGTTTTGTGTTITGSTTISGADERYTDCITAARGDVKKMQKCARLLGGG